MSNTKNEYNESQENLYPIALTKEELEMIFAMFPFYLRSIPPGDAHKERFLKTLDLEVKILKLLSP